MNPEPPSRHRVDGVNRKPAFTQFDWFSQGAVGCALGDGGHSRIRTYDFHRVNRLKSILDITLHGANGHGNTLGAHLEMMRVPVCAPLLSQTLSFAEKVGAPHPSWHVLCDLAQLRI